MNLIATIPAALGLVLAAAPALAETPQQRTVTFTTSGIDLATPAGQKELNWRIERAVRNVCDTQTADTNSRILSAEAKACIAKARSSAQRQVARIMASEGQKGG
jgi:UrcA family protein